MEDDNLLVNYTIDEAVFQVRPNVQGGRWRDRLKAKKILDRGPRKSRASVVAKDLSDPSSENETSRSEKRRKVKPSLDPKQRTTSAQNEIVSSLFTSNPVIKSNSGDTVQHDDIHVAPSNAPLPEGVHNFAAIGVNSTLGLHLSTNLQLKAPTAIQEAAIPHLLKNESDTLIQAETGSGKTLAYLIPIVQHMTTLGANGGGSKIGRKSGLFALILAPTRELAKQIDETLTALLRKLPWLVHGTVYGGTTKNHEKARIRKGINILVATPGRLSDHLDNTEALNFESVRWLVLDEGDRLVELGFEDDVRKLIERLDQPKRRKRPHTRVANGEMDILHVDDSSEMVVGLPEKRITILCSATMKKEVQNLGGSKLNDAKLVKAAPTLSVGKDSKDSKSGLAVESSVGGIISKRSIEENKNAFLAPAQLKQSFVTVPSKQRLVALHALLKRSFVRKGAFKKVIIFLSCADSVDFHFEVFGRPRTAEDVDTPSKTESGEIYAPGVAESAQIPPRDQGSTDKSARFMQRLSELPTTATSNDLPSAANPRIHLFKLHGSLPQQIRSATLSAFSKLQEPTILFCTDVASRGLDLPDIDLVIEYDPPFSSDDHLHRVGRTARAGREGQAICFLMPGPEEGYVDILHEAAGERIVKSESAEDLLRKGFQPPRKPDEGKLRRWDELATDWQLYVERWIVANPKMAEMARKAFISHVRAYATHVVKERKMFDVKELHLGHLAKAFALRDKPSGLNHLSRASTTTKGGKARSTKSERRGATKDSVGPSQESSSVVRDNVENIKPDWRSEDTTAADGQTNGRRMRAKMKEHMAIAGEFNIG